MDPLLNVILRHQIYLEGLKGGRNLQLVQTIAQLDKALRTQLAFVDYDSLGDMTKTALVKLIAELKRTARTVFDVWLNELIRWLQEYVTVDEDFWRFAYSVLEPTKTVKKDDPEKLYGAAMAFPMAANGILALSFLKGYSILAVEKIGQAVNQSYANAETPRQLTQRLFGTKDRRYTNGLTAMLLRQGDAVSDTIIQHVAAQVHASAAAKIFERYSWCSVIDDGTTQICRDRNGKVYLFGNGPVPPAHIRCRSSILPFNGTVAPDMPGFKSWASSQSEAFINDAFDGNAPSRYENAKAINLAEYRAKRSLILS